MHSIFPKCSDVLLSTEFAYVYLDVEENSLHFSFCTYIDVDLSLYITADSILGLCHTDKNIVYKHKVR